MGKEFNKTSHKMEQPSQYGGYEQNDVGVVSEVFPYTRAKLERMLSSSRPPFVERKMLKIIQKLAEGQVSGFEGLENRRK